MYEYENQNQNWNLGQPVQTPEPQKPNKQKKPHNFARGIGWGKAVNGTLKNHYPKGIRR